MCRLPGDTQLAAKCCSSINCSIAQSVICHQVRPPNDAIRWSPIEWEIHSAHHVAQLSFFFWDVHPVNWMIVCRQVCSIGVDMRDIPPPPLPHFISGLIWVQVAGVNAVQMQETPCRLARVFQIFGQTRTLLIKAEEIFTVPQTKPRVLILQGPGEQEGLQCYTLFLLKRDDWQLGENFPALNQGSYWRGQIGEQRDLAKQSNSLASCYWWKAWLLFQSFSTPHSRNSFVLLSCFLCTCAQSALHAIDCSALPNKY